MCGHNFKAHRWSSSASSPAHTMTLWLSNPDGAAVLGPSVKGISLPFLPKVISADGASGT